MQQQLSPDFYDSVAEGLLEEQPIIARRYLSLRRRAAVLHNHRMVYARMARRNPLSLFKVRPPLSFAGETGLSRSIGHLLAESGIPVALELDAKGQHRGTTVSEVVDRLNADGLSVDVKSVATMYRNFIAAAKRLGRHRAMVEDQLAEAANALAATELGRHTAPSLHDAVQQCVVYGTSRFMAHADRQSLYQVLQQIDTDSVTVGLGGKNSPLSVAGMPVDVVWSSGCGVAVVPLDQLWAVACGKGAVVVLEFMPDHWRAWSDSSELHSRPAVYKYRSTETL